jgi:hypothetical protein
MTPRRKIIEATVEDLAANFLCYDREEDEELPRGAIEEAIWAGEITRREIVELFASELEANIDKATRARG